MLTEDRRAVPRARRHLQHARVDRRRRRDAQPGADGEERLRQGRRDDSRDAGAAEAHSFNFGISTTIFSMNLDDAENILRLGARRKSSTSCSTWSASPSRCSGTPSLAETCKPVGAGRRADAPVLPRSRPHGLRCSTARTYVYMHYADMIANGYHRLAPCPFQTQGDHAESRRRAVLLREQRGHGQRARRPIPRRSTSAPRARRTGT